MSVSPFDATHGAASSTPTVTGIAPPRLSEPTSAPTIIDPLSHDVEELKAKISHIESHHLDEPNCARCRKLADTWEEEWKRLVVRRDHMQDLLQQQILEKEKQILEKEKQKTAVLEKEKEKEKQKTEEIRQKAEEARLKAIGATPATDFVQFSRQVSFIQALAMWDVTRSDKTKPPEEKSFLETIQNDWFEPYQDFCCILKALYPTDLASFPQESNHVTVGAHIIPRSHIKKSAMMLRDVLDWNPSLYNTAKNGLVLSKVFEVEFDNRNLCFVFQQHNQWKVVVFDSVLKGNVTMITRNMRPTNWKLHGLTWEEVGQAIVTIPDVVSHSALHLHAVSAHRHHHKPLKLCFDSDRTGSPDPRVRNYLDSVVPPAPE